MESGPGLRVQEMSSLGARRKRRQRIHEHGHGMRWAPNNFDNDKVVTSAYKITEWNEQLKDMYILGDSRKSTGA